MNMPARLIRDDILESERVQTLPVEARWLFVSVLLTADDVGLLELTPFKMARQSGLDIKMVPALIQLLADVDLIRCYEAGEKRYGFIPRFRQRLQIKRCRHPLPPASLMADDKDAINKINDLASIPTVDYRGIRCITVTHGVSPPEVEVEVEPLKQTPPFSPSVKKARKPPLAVADGVVWKTFERFWKAYPPSTRKVARLQCWAKWKARGLDELADQIVAHVEAMTTSDAWTKDGGQFAPAHGLPEPVTLGGPYRGPNSRIQGLYGLAGYRRVNRQDRPRNGRR